MQPRLAVLIDAENMAAKHWPKIRERIAALGVATICRVFGNLTEERLAGWVKIAEDEALQPMLQFSGPNACDIAITISAMDLLYSSKLEGFCIVSSDGDFTPLPAPATGRGPQGLRLWAGQVSAIAGQGMLGLRDSCRDL
jgi:uncharacterized LabA/DUF88 family protein